MRRQAGTRAIRTSAAVGRAPARAGAPTATPLSGATLFALQRAGVGPSRLPVRSQLARLPVGEVASLGGVVGNGVIQRAMTGDRPTLRLGSKGPAVTALQEALKAAGASIDADSVFGPRTHGAVVAFQRAAGLGADGIVGPRTWGSVDAGTVRLGQPAAGAAPTTGGLATLASAKLAELSTLVRQVKERGSRPGAGPSPAPAGPAPVPADAFGRDDDDWLDQASDAVGSAVDTVSDAASGAASAVAETAGEVYDAASETAGQVVDTVVDTATGVAHDVADAAGQAAEAVSDTVGGAVDTVTESVAGAADVVSETVGGAVDAAAETGAEVWESVKETAAEVAGVAAELTDDVKQFLGDGYTALTGILSQLADGLGIGSTGIGALDALIAKLKKMVSGEADEEGKDYSGSIETVSGGAVAGNGGCDAPPPSAAGSRRLPLRASLGMDTSTQRGPADIADAGATAHDRVDSNLSLSAKSERQTLPIPDSAFGYAMPAFSLTNGLWKTNSSWYHDHVDITATVDLANSWDVQDRGRETIRSADDEKITSTNWHDVIKDLTPTDGGAPKRHTYWAPGPTIAHEQFHCQDYTERAERYLKMATEWLMTQQVDVPFLDTEAAVRRQVKPLLEQLAKKFTADAKFHLDNGGEARAYAATRGGYDKIVDGIWTRAVREKWV